MSKKEEYQGKDENLEAEDAEYSTKSDFSKAEIAKLQVLKCNETRSKEMKEGYFNYDKFGNKTYVPDSRKEWISAVKALKHLLAPEIAKIAGFDEKINKILEKEQEATKEFGIFPQKVIGTEIKPDLSSKKFIPYVDEPFPVRKIISGGGLVTIEYVRGLYNYNIQAYWDTLVEVYDLLFAELNKLIHACNYFKQQIAY